MSLKTLLIRIGRMSEMLAVSSIAFLLLLSWACYAYSRVSEESLEKARKNMVSWQIQRRGIVNKLVLDAMLKIERHQFIPEKLIHYAYDDRPLPIGENQTISQPYIVALMTQLLKPKKTDVVLEIGTGSGYQAAVLAECVKEVYSIEIVEKLGKRAQKLLEELKYENIHLRIGDGYQGWPEHAPFDKIIVTAAPDHVPKPLIAQLKTGGCMVIPVGKSHQELLVITKDEKGVKQEQTIPVRFVPMTGEAEKE